MTNLNIILQIKFCCPFAIIIRKKYIAHHNVDAHFRLDPPSHPSPQRPVKAI